MTRDDINAFGDRIKALLLDGDTALLVEVGAKAPTDTCPSTSALATVRGTVGATGLHDFTGNALHLEDAIWLARGKLRDARKAHEKKLAEAKEQG